MLILHTADLHLGKTIHERDLLPDQEHVLGQLLGLLAERRPAALLIAGDLYDRSIPPPEALRLFDSFLVSAVEADPGLTIVIIPGNHDSAARLSFGAELLSRARVHLRTRVEDCVRPILVERGGERAAVWALPFLGPGAFEGSHRDAGRGDAAAAPPSGGAAGGEPGGPAASAQGELPFLEEEPPVAPAVLRSQSELFAEAMRRIRPLLLDDSANVFMAHCFAAGGAASESERIFVGGSEQVEAGLMDVFDYAALGHLHRPQRAGKAGRYPGSPLAYSFSEADHEKGFLLVDVRRGGSEAELVRITPLRAMRRIEGPFSALAAPGAFAELREDFVEARLTDSLPVINPSDPLRLNFPHLLSVRQAAFELQAPGGAYAPGGRPVEAGGTGSVLEDFLAFHEEMRGEAADEGTAALFAQLAKEAESESA